MQDEKPLSARQLKRRNAFLVEAGVGKFDLSDSSLFAKSGISQGKARGIAILALLVSFFVPLLLIFLINRIFPGKVHFLIQICSFVVISIFIRYYSLKTMLVYYKNKTYRRA